MVECAFIQNATANIFISNGLNFPSSHSLLSVADFININRIMYKVVLFVNQLYGEQECVVLGGDRGGVAWTRSTVSTEQAHQTNIEKFSQSVILHVNLILHKFRILNVSKIVLKSSLEFTGGNSRVCTTWDLIRSKSSNLSSSQCTLYLLLLLHICSSTICW